MDFKLSKANGQFHLEVEVKSAQTFDFATLEEALSKYSELNAQAEAQPVA